jgi:hypothetical protein
MSALLRGDGPGAERSMEIERPLAVIETDLFCRGCGYNMHTQRVWRDPRLGVMVCRCPECGLHESADVASGIGNMWSRQFGQFILALWLCVVTVGTYWAVYSLSYAQIGYVALSQTTPDRISSIEIDSMKAVCLAFETIESFWLATTISLLLLHHKRAWGYVGVAIPLMALVWTLFVQPLRPPGPLAQGWQPAISLAQIGCYQISGFLLGAALGRSVVRKIAAYALPPWAIRAMAFLWLSEGKELPAQARK